MITKQKAREARALWSRPSLWITGGVLLAVAATTYLLAQRQPEVMVSDSGIRVLVAGKSDSGMDSRIDGRLTDMDGCLGIQSGSRQVLAIWPNGTTALPGSSLRVQLPDDSVVSLGDSIEGGGGFIERKPYPSSVPEIPRECAADQFFLFDTVKLME